MRPHRFFKSFEYNYATTIEFQPKFCERIRAYRLLTFMDGGRTSFSKQGGLVRPAEAKQHARVN